MPILKAISGHTGVHGIKAYLEKADRALARDFFNLSWDEREMGGYDGEDKATVPWDIEMDETRTEFGHDREWKGKRPRTFDHFVLSPDPQDRIDLPALRELARDWALEQFGDHQIAIIYHDDNEHHIPHAHIVVNCTDLATGYKTHIVRPEDLNRRVQDMARERGLRGLSNETDPKTGLERLVAKSTDVEKVRPIRTRKAVYIGRAESEIMAEQGWSWVADIRNRVGIAKTLARNEAEFRGLLDMMEVRITESTSKRNGGDWIFSFEEEPSKKVSGQRLGLSYGREAIERKFERTESYRPTEKSCEVLRSRAEKAIEINDLGDLDNLARALGICSRFNIRCMADFDRRLDGRVTMSEQSRHEILAARDYMETNNLLPQSIAYARQPHRKHDDSAAASASAAAARRRQQQIQAQQQEQQRQRRKER